jgi:hypothetical protein
MASFRVASEEGYRFKRSPRYDSITITGPALSAK